MTIDRKTFHKSVLFFVFVIFYSLFVYLQGGVYSSVCVYVSQESISDAISQDYHNLILRQGLSLSWSSPSRLD